MENVVFRMTKQVQEASDYRLQWFPNGANRQIIYTVYNGSKIVKTLVSTEYSKIMYCHIIKIGDYFEFRFSVNPTKKYWEKAYQVISAE